MKNINIRAALAAVCVASVLATFSRVDAAPVRFDQVIQILNARPGKAETATFSRIVVAGSYTASLTDDDDEKKKPAKETVPQDDRVITDTKTEIIEDSPCDCEDDIEKRRGFPKWALLGLAAIPIAFIIIKRRKDTPTPTQTIPITQTPTPTPTTTITPTPTKTPPMTPTPTPPPEPVPEPMTLLLFGTGLASIGLAARRRLGRKRREDENED